MDCGSLPISSCLDSLRGCADQAKRCAEPYITTQLTIRTRRWTEGRVGAGDVVTLKNTVLPKRYPVRELSQRAVSGSGGKYQAGDVKVEDISPPYSSHGGGGFSQEDLDPRRLPIPTNDIEVLYILAGDVSGVFAFVDLDSSDPTDWSLVLRRTRLSP
jgi:hypothetical protein